MNNANLSQATRQIALERQTRRHFLSGVTRDSRHATTLVLSGVDHPKSTCPFQGLKQKWSLLIIVGCVTLFANRGLAGGLDLFSEDLRSAKARLLESRQQLDTLGPLSLRQTVTQMGGQLSMRPAPPPQPPSIQLDLGSVESFDRIMIVPSILGVASDDPKPYAFPERFRIDISASKNFNEFRLIYDSQEDKLDTSSPFPVVIETPGARTRYLRITVTELAKVTGHWTYALSEVMLIRGDRNVAFDAAVTMTDSGVLPPVWNAAYLVDGRTPLGPPIRPARSNAELPRFDGVFCKSEDVDQELWFQIDLGRSETIDAIRIFPVHARQGADFPGYGFPLRFRMEGSNEPSFQNSAVLFKTKKDFSNPGNNPVVFNLPDSSLRYLRIVSERGSNPKSNKFGFAEVQILRESENLAANTSVTALHWQDERRLSVLVDNEASYGPLATLSQWSQHWQSVRQRLGEIQVAEHRIERYTVVARRRAAWTGALCAALVGLALFALAWIGRRRRTRHRADFRMRLAQDLHDEIGSNLAAIARLAEVGEAVVDDNQPADDWRSVRELAGECNESMHETLWLLGGPKRDGDSLADRLRCTATRMLSGVELLWHTDDAFANYRPGDATERELVLVFKAILANIARSSHATEVEVVAEKVPGKPEGTVPEQWQISVGDNGKGFDTVAWEKKMAPQGMGLDSMQSRIKKLGGTLTINSRPDEGTRVTMLMPN